MFAALAPYKLLLECLAFGALVVAIALGIHSFLDYEQNIGYQKAVAEYTAKQLAAEQRARQLEQELTKVKEKAQDEANIRDRQIQALSDAVTASSGGLRNLSNNLRNSLSGSSLESARKTADAALAVFGDCQEKYGAVAAAADRHASDVKTLKDSWPVTK